MPDWIAHILFAYILSEVLSFKFNALKEGRYVALVMVGSLIPDLVKIEIIFDLAGMDVSEFLEPLHTPAGALLSASLISLLFYGTIFVFSLLSLGLTTHFALDLLLKHVSGGMLMLFPFSWNEYQLGLIQSDNFNITLVILVLASFLYLYRAKNQKI